MAAGLRPDLPDRSGKPERPGRLKRQVRRNLGKGLMRSLGPRTYKLLSRTWRYEVLHPERCEQARGPSGGVLLSLWHGRMLLCMPPYRGQAASILVSPSGDGDLSEALLKGYGYGVIRGSSSRGGARALRAMLAALGSGALLAVTPDGPRGPRHSMNHGLAWMARATAHAILPHGFACDRAWRARSWDRFTLPKPRARIVLAYGEPLFVPRDATDSELRRASEVVRERMLAAERAAFAHLGLEPDF